VLYRSHVTIAGGDDPRTSLNEELLRAALLERDCAEVGVRVLPETGSTNHDCAQALDAGAQMPLAVTTDLQTTGRGRLDRVWQAPAASSVLLSIAVEPTAPIARWGWLPLLAGVAVCRAVAEFGVELSLKWPNDLMAKTVEGGAGKVGGILVERRSSSAVIVGIGINVNQSASELPGPQAQSLRTLGAGSVNRERLIAAVVAHLLGELSRWNSQGGDAQAGLAADYTALCLTVGQRVQAILPSAEPLEGIAVGVADSGALLISTDTQIHEVSAGDIVHLRPNIVGG